MKKQTIKPIRIKGAEGIVLHNGNIVLGMQKLKRWYELKGGKTAAIIKTLGGQIEDVDEESSKTALVREVLEEVEGLDKNNIRVSKSPVFTKNVIMGKLNPYEKDSNLNMVADFYLLEIVNKNNIFPNDLPALVEISINVFLKINFSQEDEIKTLKNWIIKNNKKSIKLPEYYALMIPNEVKTFLMKCNLEFSLLW